MLEPLAVDPNRSLAPAANSIASARLVFPAPAGPTSAITRVPLDSPGCLSAMRDSPSSGYGRASRSLKRRSGAVWKPPPSACFQAKARGLVRLAGVLGRLGPGDIFVDVFGEHVHRHVAAFDHCIVERLEVIFGAERRLRLVAQGDDGRMADLVAAGLAGPGAIAVDLARHFERVGAVDVDEIIDALLAGPALGMDARIDHQAAAAEGDRLEIAEAADGEVVIDAKLVDQLLGIERPAFGLTVEREQRADERRLLAIFAWPDV